MNQLLRALTVVLLAFALVGCATIKNAVGSKGQKLDPWESWNRKVFSFNETVDANVLIPRPETELLVEAVLEHLARTEVERRPPRVLDL